MRKGARTVPWSTSDEAYLVEHAGLADAADIARHLKRSRSSVRHKAMRLGVSLRYTPERGSGLVWCDVCGTMRNGTPDGACRVCKARRQLAALRDANARAKAESDAVEREIEREKNRVKMETHRLRTASGTAPRKRGAMEQSNGTQG